MNEIDSRKLLAFDGNSCIRQATVEESFLAPDALYVRHATLPSNQTTSGKGRLPNRKIGAVEPPLTGNQIRSCGHTEQLGDLSCAITGGVNSQRS
jgi:hypothetical protein